MLSIHLLLENGGKTYLKSIQELVEGGYDLRLIVNSTEYDSWYGTHLHCLCYLVGDLVKTYENDKLVTAFYGSGSKIDEETGILILKYLKLGGIDVNIEDYYERTALEAIKESCLTKRTGNETFMEELEKLY